MSARIITTYNYVWTATFDDYDGAPDAGHQCIGMGDPRPGGENTEFAAVLDLYNDWEGWFEEPLVAHRPGFEEDIWVGCIWGAILYDSVHEAIAL